jgi:hypothetical protein
LLDQIRKNGEILSETTYQLNLSRKEEIRKENNLLLRAISDKKRELEREQHALVARTVDDIAKMEKVLRVKVSIFILCLMLPVFLDLCTAKHVIYAMRPVQITL